MEFRAAGLACLVCSFCFVVTIVEGQVTNNGVTIGAIATTPNAPVGLTATGLVFGASADTFHLTNFVLNPVSSTSRYYFAGSAMVGANSAQEADITRFPNEYGDSLQLEAYASKSFVIILSGGQTITDFVYFGVWDAAQLRFIAGTVIPSNLALPQPVTLPAFTTLQHLVASGPLVALDKKRLMIPNFVYDGAGPDAFFYYGTSGGPSANGFKIADENGNIDTRLGSYNGETITITLPGDVTVDDVAWLSVWCIRFTSDFGNLIFPAGPLNVPPYLSYGTVQKRAGNCESMEDQMQVSWSLVGDSIRFELAGIIDASNYMAFGLSGDNSRPLMVGGDVVVVDFQRSTPRALDYYLSAYAQCDVSGNGACPDTSSTTATNTNDATDVSGSKENGIIRVSYTRKLMTMDGAPADQQYTPGTVQQVIWGVGPLNGDGETAKHTFRNTASKTIDFGRTVANNCPPLVNTGNTATLPPFQEQVITAPSDTEFTVEIGNSGSTQGYQAIAGEVSWGIALWINGVLIPRLRLRRGSTYTFSVAMGRDPTDPGRYHPFYITNDNIGGYSQKTQAEKDSVSIYAGVEANGTLTGVGDYCEWGLKSTEIGNTYQTIQEFTAAHQQTCAGPVRGIVTFTPDDSTPDTVYYQCYTHKNLGYRIDLVTDGSSSAFAVSSLLVSLMMTFAAVLIG